MILGEKHCGEYREMLSNFILSDKVLDWSKFKVFADNKFKVLKMMIFVFNRVETIVGKGENDGYQYFLLFPQCF